MPAQQAFAFEEVEAGQHAVVRQAETTQLRRSEDAKPERGRVDELWTKLNEGQVEAGQCREAARLVGLELARGHQQNGTLRRLDELGQLCDGRHFGDEVHGPGVVCVAGGRARDIKRTAAAAPRDAFVRDAQRGSHPPGRGRDRGRSS
jgi:hypothetical protein